MKEEMQELYVEGVAIHDGPAPCGGAREGAAEALDRGTCRQAIEPRNSEIRGADAVGKAEGNTLRGASASRKGPRGVRDPSHARNLHAREPGDPVLTRRRQSRRRDAQGRLRPQA